MQEMKQWILRSFHLLNVEESEERFEDHDEDKDGSVSWKEYMMEERIIMNNVGMERNEIGNLCRSLI